jgi:hypothetical protein
MNHKLAEAPQPADNIVIWPCELHRDKSFTISVTQPSVPPRQVCPVCEPNYWQPQDAPVEPAPPAQPTPLTDDKLDLLFRMYVDPHATKATNAARSFAREVERAHGIDYAAPAR